MALSTKSRDADFSPSDRFTARDYPELIKYMGSKSKIIGEVVSALNLAYAGGTLCDLFAGSCSLSAALKNQAPIISNDIQAYSAVIAETYLNAWYDERTFPPGDLIVSKAQAIATTVLHTIPVGAEYFDVESLSEFNEVEERSRGLLGRDFGHRYHLFVKYYSGTWWSTLQCVWIDAIREVAEEYRTTPFYQAIVSSLMFAMAYASQGTGHYAQYRDATSASAMQDILIYRRKSVPNLFLKKYAQLCNYLPKSPPRYPNLAVAKDYLECLEDLEPGSTIYADPPYCFVHYSRFYHALETLVLYDYPELQVKGGALVKGRYRESRHQSPFCIRSKVQGAFAGLFDGVAAKSSSLVLSYSNTGMIELAELEALMRKHLGPKYTCSLRTVSHKHMTMGRRADRDRDVKEALLIGYLRV